MKKRAYLRDPEVPMPDTRFQHAESTYASRKRKRYLRDPKCLIPRQTRWYQSKKSETSYDTKQLSHEDDDTLSSEEDYLPDIAHEPQNKSTDELNAIHYTTQATTSSEIYYTDDSYNDDSTGSIIDSSSSIAVNPSLSRSSTPSLTSDEDRELHNPCSDNSSLFAISDDEEELEGISDNDSFGSNLATSSPSQSHLTTNQDADTPLYPGAPISCRESWTSIYKFCVSNRLTDSASQQLLDLVCKHCPVPNSCPQTVYKLKKQAGLVECMHFQYCSLCMIEVPLHEKKCGSCIDKNSQMCYYTLLPFEKHLAEIFSENWDMVQYPFTRSVLPGILQDIHDGKRYKRLSSPGKFFSVPEHAGLILCTDGVPLFKSSGQSLWPVQLCITNLPPNVRMDLRNLLLAGVWLGPVKPEMPIILQPILDKIHSLYEQGIQLSTPVGPKCLKAKLLCCVFDLPARAMALNLLQWNGRHGCTYCLDEGTQVSHARLYLPDDEHSSRTEKQTLQYAEEASSASPKFGVKGSSVLSPYLNIVKDVAIDYMHAVLEGVVKTMILKFWFCGKYKDYRFYLSKEVKEIDKLLLSIKPPHEFRRTPRAIEKTVKYWKASEFRAWLLFYSVPLLYNFLHRDYVHHLNLLVKSVHILLSTHISSDDLSIASKMLNVFYDKIVDLYPKDICTMNVHSLIHLVEIVRNFGPLWSYSCFGFESMNGHLKKHCHGTRNVLPQLTRNLRFHQAVLDEEYRSENHEDGVRSRVKEQKLCSEFLEALHQAQYSVSSSIFPVFYRYKLNGVLYQALKNSKQLRNSSVCKFKMACGSSLLQH